MRIVLTSNYKIGNETGASAVTDLLVQKLSIKHKILYLCLGNKYKLIRKTKDLNILNIPSFSINNIDIPLITPQVVLLSNTVLEKFNPDIVHTQNSVLISKFAQVWANKNNVPLITTFHHIPTQVLEHLLPKLKKNYLAQVVQEFYSQTTLKNFLHNCHSIVALNKYQYKSIRKIDKKVQIVTINNGLDLQKFWSIKRNKLDLKKDINFIFLGSYNMRKNQMLLVKTFKHLPDNFKLNLYGNFNSGKDYINKLARYIKTNRIKNVYLNDFIKTKKIIEVYQKSHFFISASLKEVQSLAVVEALASGLPVIGLENETTNELVNSKNGLLLSKEISINNFAKKIIRLIKNVDYLDLSKNARLTSKKFDINKTILKIEDVYKSACNSNS